MDAEPSPSIPKPLDSRLYLGWDWLSLWVDKLKCEVSNHPYELREILRVVIAVDFFLVVLGANMDVFCEIDNQWEILNCILINASNTVVNKATAQQNCKWKYSGIMCWILIQSYNPFSINDNHIDYISLGGLTFNWLSPNPNPLRARINRWPNSESVRSV